MTTRNDTPYSTEEIAAYLQKYGVQVVYGDLMMLVLPAQLAEAREIVAKMPTAARGQIMTSVDDSLRAALDKVKDNTASRQQMDDFHSDLLLWTALREVTAS
jgi:histidinol dehydrogenase